MKKTVVLYPGLAVSHFVPMVQLADAFLEEGYAVTVALIDPALKQDIAFVATVARVASSKPSVTFHTLPPIENPPAMAHDERFLTRYLDLLSRYNHHLHDFLRSLPAGSVHALVVDMLSFEALDVARKLGIPAYTFYSPCASALALSFQLTSMTCSADGGRPTNLKELGDTPLTFHGVPPLPASHLMAEQLASPGTETYRAMTNAKRGVTEPDGLLVNSVESLEPRAVAALRDPQCCPMMPLVYCVGPLVAGTGGGEEKATTGEKHECLAWLDEQPDRSVVFLCFGSIGAATHSAKQLAEIAAGLEKSGHRFLWVVRAPPPPDDNDDPEKPFDPRADPDLATLLPEGFLERTRGRGVVVKLWAPQVDVLRHRATGAFVTHCGWNSVLEGVLAGVPMLCWPMYAEQKMNKVFMVEEFGIGVGVDVWQHAGVVTAEEVESKVRLVMGASEEAERLRARVAEHRDAAAVAWKDGGSSRRAFTRFLSDASSLRLGPAPAARRT